MATTTKYASSHVTGNVTTPNNALGAADATYTADADNTSWTSRWALSYSDLGSVTLNSGQSVTIRTRKFGNGGASGTPTYTLNLYENGSLTGQLGTTISVTSTTSQDNTFNWNPSTPFISTVELELVTTAAGGGPSARAAVQVDAFTWTVDYTEPLQATASGQSSTSGSGAIRLDIPMTADGQSTTSGSAAPRTLFLPTATALSNSSTVTPDAAARTQFRPTATGQSTSSGSAQIKTIILSTGTALALTSGSLDARRIQWVVPAGQSNSSGQLNAFLALNVTASGQSNSSSTSAAIRRKIAMTGSGQSNSSSAQSAATISLGTTFIGWGVPL